MEKNLDQMMKGVEKNPFRVPDGYFEGLTQQVMDALPEKEMPDEIRLRPTLWQRVRPLVYLAAMMVGAALLLRVATSNLAPGGETGVSTDESEADMEYIATAIDNSMMDDYALYVYLQEE